MIFFLSVFGYGAASVIPYHTWSILKCRPFWFVLHALLYHHRFHVEELEKKELPDKYFYVFLQLLFENVSSYEKNIMRKVFPPRILMSILCDGLMSSYIICAATDCCVK